MKTNDFILETSSRIFSKSMAEYGRVSDGEASIEAELAIKYATILAERLLSYGVFDDENYLFSKIAKEL